MAIHLACPHCARVMQIPDAWIGLQTTCPTCGGGFIAQAAVTQVTERRVESPSISAAPPPSFEFEEGHRSRRPRENTAATAVVIFTLASLVTAGGTAAWIILQPRQSAPAVATAPKKTKKGSPKEVETVAKTEPIPRPLPLLNPPPPSGPTQAEIEELASGEMAKRRLDERQRRIGMLTEVEIDAGKRCVQQIKNNGLEKADYLTIKYAELYDPDFIESERVNLGAHRIKMSNLRGLYPEFFGKDDVKHEMARRAGSMSIFEFSDAIQGVREIHGKITPAPLNLLAVQKLVPELVGRLRLKQQDN